MYVYDMFVCFVFCFLLFFFKNLVLILTLLCVLMFSFCCLLIYLYEIHQSALIYIQTSTCINSIHYRYKDVYVLTSVYIFTYAYFMIFLKELREGRR